MFKFFVNYNYQEKTLDKMKYSINLMWINRTLEPHNRFISRHTTKQELISELLEKVKKWKVANPDATVNLYYDKEFVTNAQLVATQHVIDEMATQDPDHCPVLKNIRDITIVRDNPDAFSDYIPVYTRVDLLKLIICVHEIEHEFQDVTIYSDLEVGDLRPDHGRLNKAELFNHDVMNKLTRLGFIQGLDSYKLENQFFQVMNNAKTLLGFKIYINANLHWINFALNCRWSLDDTPYKLRTMTDLCQMTFAQQELLHNLVGAFVFDRPIKISNPDRSQINQPEINYDPAVHETLILGNFYQRNYGTTFFIPDFDLSSQQPVIPLRKRVTLPTFINEMSYDLMSRNDLATRTGGTHIEQFSNLVIRLPADNSDTYKLTPYNVSGVQSSVTNRMQPR